MEEEKAPSIWLKAKMVANDILDCVNKMPEKGIVDREGKDMPRIIIQGLALALCSFASVAGMKRESLIERVKLTWQAVEKGQLKIMN